MSLQHRVTGWFFTVIGGACLAMALSWVNDSYPRVPTSLFWYFLIVAGALGTAGGVATFQHLRSQEPLGFFLLIGAVITMFLPLVLSIIGGVKMDWDVPYIGGFIVMIIGGSLCLFAPEPRWASIQEGCSADPVRVSCVRPCSGGPQKG